MRAALLVICLASPAWAEPALQEYNGGQKLAPAETLHLGPCDIDVAFAGAIADVELHQRIRNPGPGDLAATFDFELPTAARLIGFALRDRTTSTAVGVMSGGQTQIADAPDVIGADPALVQKLGVDAVAHRDRYRAIVQPIPQDREIMLALRWTEIAEIHDAALHLPLFAKLDASACLVRVRATPGPGATVQRIRALGEVLPNRNSTFTLAGADAQIAVDLAFAKPTPIAWVQDQDLGGFTARALTMLAPPARATTGAQHTLLVIDTSRSMELVGRNRVRQVVKAIGGVLPKDAHVEAIVYDRTAERVLGSWLPADASAFAAIDAALAKRPAQNGSDAAAALALAHQLVAADSSRGQTMIVTIGDGSFGDIGDGALTHALDMKSDAVDVHAIVLDPTNMHAPNGDALRDTVTHFGGSYVEVDAGTLDEALAGLDAWLRPGWVGLGVTGGFTEPPVEVRAGAGFVALTVVKRAHKAAVTGNGETTFAIDAQKAPAVPIAQLALAASVDEDFGAIDIGHDVRQHMLLHHTSVDDEHELAILAGTGRVAQSRKQMIAGGGPYTRLVAIADPVTVRIGPARAMTLSSSALDRTIIKRLLVDQLQPHAYSCFQRAIATAPKLAGTAKLQIEIGRGEVSRVTVTGLGNAGFDTCLVDAAYGMSPPLPTPGVNVDDRVIVNYPITFAVREDKPFVLAGDADSTTPLDIEAIEGGVPRRLSVDTSTPLGGLKPSRSP